ncbi:hypothetical protein ACWKWU_22625 [Chitinophaga lutea]
MQLSDTRPLRQPLIFLHNEAYALLGRLRQVKPFSMTMPAVWAATVSDDAMQGMTDHMARGVGELRGRIEAFIRFLQTPAARRLPAPALQARFALLKLRFNEILDQLDIFADVLAQRSEHTTGVWVAGLDILAADTLRLPHPLYDAPPVMCFLERGHGAAIRKARTRLPGGDRNPVAIIQVPRERMIGSGIAASVVHEVGHQGAALLGLVNSLRAELAVMEKQDPARRTGWNLYGRWISEIVADAWAMAHLGIGATLGLMGVVSLPRYFMFRFKGDDPHPFPWIRVQLSIAFGRQLFPHPQWDRLQTLWERLYPLQGQKAGELQTIGVLQSTARDFVRLVCNHRPPALQGRSFAQLFPIGERQPDQLRARFRQWKEQPNGMLLAPPSETFAVIGQARADNLIPDSVETAWIGKLLNQWAFMYAENRTRKDGARIARAMKGFIQS